MEFPESFNNVKLILLDMDGVLTSEEAYWDAAGLVVRDILESPAFLGLNPDAYTPIVNLFYQQLSKGGREDWRAYLPAELIRACKSRGINSNWDLAYLGLGLYLAPLTAPVLNALLAPQTTGSEFLQSEASQATGHSPYSQGSVGDQTLSRMREILSPAWERMTDCVQTEAYGQTLRAADLHLWGAYLRSRKQTISPGAYPGLPVFEGFSKSAKGTQLLDELNCFVDERENERPSWFGRRSALWHDCRDLFQQWYLGEALYTEIHQAPVQYGPKPGLIHKEEPLGNREKTHACLSALVEAGYTLGIATGRPRMEIITPLQRWGMLDYFDSERIATHDEIEQAEMALGDDGERPLLGKPHPYVFLKAAFPHRTPAELAAMAQERIPHSEEIVVVGDAQADIWAAQAMGCPSVALLTGAAGLEGRASLDEAKPSAVCADLFDLCEALTRKP